MPSDFERNALGNDGVGQFVPLLKAQSPEHHGETLGKVAVAQGKYAGSWLAVPKDCLVTPLPAREFAKF